MSRQLHEISCAVPEEVWLTEFYSKKGTGKTGKYMLEVKGVAQGATAASLFLHNLEENSLFRDITLKEIGISGFSAQSPKPGTKNNFTLFFIVANVRS